MSETYLFIEAKGFTHVHKAYFGSDEAYAEFQLSLAANPDKGTVIPGAAPLRKVRWGDKGRGIGRSGGLRIIYIHIPEVSVLFLLDVYGKNEAEDLASDEKKELQTMARQLVAELTQKFLPRGKK